ncbi:MAG: transcription termination factor Rho [Acidimicrobiia bacterium]|nr:transcription termination factor Rho [Acidimicrobiia bacterium]
MQKKDREQLQAIATAMGRKPPSRARKDQIIDLILELSGVGGGGAATEAAPAPKRGRAKARSDEAPSLFTEAAGGSPAGAAEGAAPADAAEGSPADASANGGAAEVAPTAVARPTAPAQTGAAEGESESEGDAANEGEGEATAAPGPTSRRGNGRAARAAEREPAVVAPTSGRSPSGRSPDRPSTGRGEPRRQAEPKAGGPGARFVFDPLEGRADSGPALDEEQVPERRGDAGEHDDEVGPRGRDHGQANDAGGDGTGRRRRRRGKDRNRPEGLPPAAQPHANPAPESAPAPSPGGDLEQVQVGGHLDLREEGYGFLRVRGYLPSKEDVYVPSKFVRQFGLRKGDQVTGASRPAGRGEKNPALLRVDQINGRDPEQARGRSRFEDLTPQFPDERLRLESPDGPVDLTARVIDLVSPIGKGQRGLIVSPPKAGKTTVMRQVAQAIERNNPEVKLIVLLVDERPEEVTDMRRSIQGEVVASTFDRPADEHTQVAELTLERAKRMVESGDDVVIILDGITRLARAYNLAAPATGRVMSGGIDTGALYPPKKFFGAARNVDEGGSLTILATALVETGSRMDEVIFEEFKGTGNLELRLDRRLAEKRIFPAIDVDASSTRHEELLFEPEQLQQVWKLRRVLAGLAGEGGGQAAGLELLLDRMQTFPSNDEFLAEVAKAPSL